MKPMHPRSDADADADADATSSSEWRDNQVIKREISHLLTQTSMFGDHLLNGTITSIHDVRCPKVGPHQVAYETVARLLQLQRA